jgi:hypothetical protein
MVEHYQQQTRRSLPPHVSTLIFPRHNQAPAAAPAGIPVYTHDKVVTDSLRERWFGDWTTRPCHRSWKMIFTLPRLSNVESVDSAGKQRRNVDWDNTHR